MRLHIAGIGGTFMGGLALLARDLGHEVSGSDGKVYPPMSTQLEEQGIVLQEGYTPAHLEPTPDRVIIGNALSRGNPLVEAVLDRNLPYTSGAQWLAESVLPGRWVLAVAGTHGKTTTACMLAWILEYAGLNPGFLIGGVPENFGISARLGGSQFFVVEADEYDTAFFDKRSKFLHYRPRTVVLNNLEYDHADIFPDLDAIKRQFHHLVRTIPASGLIIAPANDAQLAEVLAQGCWTSVEWLHSPDGWSTTELVADGSRFSVLHNGVSQGEVAWELYGRHNVSNALAAIAAAQHVGVAAETALTALTQFRNVRRRLEIYGTACGVTVYDDFAHHPTAIAASLQALRARVGKARIFAVLEPRSNTMRLGVHRDVLPSSLALADRVLLFKPAGLNWDLDRVCATLSTDNAKTYKSVEEIVGALTADTRSGDHVLIMSNGGFENIYQRLLLGLQESGTTASSSRSA